MGTGLGWVIAALNLWAGGCLRRRRKRWVVMTASVLNCLSIPLGLILAIFTFVVIGRPQVKAAFEAND